MTNPIIDLPGVIAKSDDADFLRELIQDAAQRLMDIEVAAVCGAAHVLPVHSAHPGSAVNAALSLRSRHRAERVARLDRQQDPRRRHRPELAWRPACRGHHGDGRPAAQSVA